jgi:hypothetical protein
VEFESTRMCELLVGLPDVNVLAVVDVAGEPLRVHVETRELRPWCPGCGGEVAVKDRPAVGAGRPGGVRPPRPARLAQAPVELPEPVVPGRLLDR